MPNLLTTHTATFRQPSETVPLTHSTYLALDVVFSQASSREVYWAKFSGTAYEYKIVGVLPESLRAILTEEWRVSVNSEDYTVKSIKHIETPFGYDHSTLGVSKIER